jgi:mannose-6-phosphate isomerase
MVQSLRLDHSPLNIMTKQLYPLIFKPVLKDYIWGGRNLEKLGRTLPPGKTAESWEIAAHEDGTAVVSNGHFAGKLLTEVHQELGLDLIGHNNAWAQERNKFPLLIKLLDANRPLSVQVHPNDEYALGHEGNELGKTEMWVVLHAEPDGAIIFGVKKGTTLANFRQAILDGDLEQYLHQVPVKAGDVVCVPAGSLHAILGGLIIAEIQQNSNTTYRVYDWNRVGADGQARPLHIDKALDVINFAQVEPDLCQPELIHDADGVRRHQLCHNRYFVTERVEMAAGAMFNGRCDGSTLEIWGVIDGEVAINDVALTAVRFALLPAAMGNFTIKATTGAALLRSYVSGESGS